MSKWDPRHYGAWGPTWDAMTAKEKKWAVVTDWLLGIVGAALIYLWLSNV